MQIRLKHNIEYQIRGYLLPQQGSVQEVITDLFVVEQYLQFMEVELQIVVLDSINKMY